ncbi:MAG: slipin family protein [Spirochaetia bacterium]|jgi:regulator of protease activity HflC (stomatin/prohibitin superfamily)|nr:slipin family protein [Spirochaetia bacterium]
MKYSSNKFDRIKNIQGFTLKKDYVFNVFSFMILALFFGLAILVQTVFVGPIEPLIMGKTTGSIIGVGILLMALPLWSSSIMMIILIWSGMLLGELSSLYPMFAIISLGLILSPSFQIILEWDKAVILRLGKFKKVHGPGIFFIFPVIDRIAREIDTRIRATDFSAEKTLTKDTVPVHVDALAFWMIWDAQKAVLEVENFLEAITLSAQTALRASIGKNRLATLLSDRDLICNEIQQMLDQKTNSWGISILSVEITDIVIPENLEDAMSKVAQAEREKESRVILGSAEVEIAAKFEQAAEHYRDNPTALHLRAMNMAYEGLRQKGSLMVLPSSALDSMNIGSTMGMAALDKIDTIKKENEGGDL